MASSTPKTHIDRPTNERRFMCGKRKGAESKTPGKATCITCSKLYQTNKKWFASMKRKMTLAAKKGNKVTS